MTTAVMEDTMIGTDTSEIILEIVSNQATIKATDIRLTTPLKSLAIDSLGMVEIIFELEEKFDIEIPESINIADRFKNFSTPGDIMRAVDELIALKG